MEAQWGVDGDDWVMDSTDEPEGSLGRTGERHDRRGRLVGCQRRAEPSLGWDCGIG